MPDFDIYREDLTRFLGQAKTMTGQELEKSYLDLDKKISKLEESVALRAHNLTIAKDIAYAGNLRLNDCSSQNLSLAFALFRDAASFLANFRQLLRHLRHFYENAACLLEKAGNTYLALQAREQSYTYSPDSLQRNSIEQPDITDIQGWFERPCRMSDNSYLAIDYPVGQLVRITPEGEVKALENEVPQPVHDIIKTGSNWLLIGEQGKQLFETDSQFQIKQTFDLELNQAPIARHGAIQKGSFACTQYDADLHIFNKDLTKKTTFKMPGATQLRRPLYHQNFLLFINFSQPTAGCSEVLRLDKNGCLRTIYQGLDGPMNLAFHLGEGVIDDKNGLHFISAQMSSGHEKILFYSDLPVEQNKSPYCASISLTDKGLTLFVMYNEDFLSGRQLSQRLLYIKTKEQ